MVTVQTGSAPSEWNENVTFMKIQLTQQMFSLHILTREPYYKVSLIYALFAKGHYYRFRPFQTVFLVFRCYNFYATQSPYFVLGVP